MEHAHHARGPSIQVLPDAMFKKGHIDDAVVLGHADALTEVTDRLRCVAPPAHAGDGGHPGIIPSLYVFLHDQLDQPSLAQDRVAQVETGELDLLRMIFHSQLVQKPIVQGAVVLEFQGADRVGNPLNGIREAMGKVVHRVDAPLIAGPVVRRPFDPVYDRVAHHDVRRGHIDLGPKHIGPVFKFPCSHALEEVEVLLQLTGFDPGSPCRPPSGCRETPGSHPHSGLTHRPFPP